MVVMLRLVGEGERVFEGDEGQTVLECLLNNGVALPFDCRAGNCGTCKCELLEGEVEDMPFSPYALAAEERRAGVILACRAQLWSDCTLRRLDDDDQPLHRSVHLRCRVSEVAALTHDIWQLTLSTPRGEAVDFSVGQYMNLTFPGSLPARSYSLTSRPGFSQLSFHIRQVSGGAVTSQLLARLRIGDEVSVEGPHGHAHLRTHHRGPLLAVAGGSGLGVIQSIVEAALVRAPERTVRAYFGARAERDVYGEAAWSRLRDTGADLAWTVALSQSCASHRASGNIADIVARDFDSLSGWKVYAAGPPGMVDDLRRVTTARGVALRDFHADAFWSAGSSGNGLLPKQRFSTESSA